MNIVILGPQGSGKGTQAKLLAERFDLFYFEAGAFLRELAQKNNKVKEIIDAGNIVPGKEMSSYIEAFFDEKEIYNDILFDGFPRTLDQYNFVKNWMDEKNIKFDLVVVLKVSSEVSIKRLILRRREDDTTEAIERRLELYKKETMPLIYELKKDTKVIEIDGERAVEEIQKDIERIVHEQINN